jgi:hypothetical protein
MAIRLSGSLLNSRRYTTLRPVCIDRSLGRPVCLSCSGSMSSIKLATAPSHHQCETGQNGKNHDQHEDHADRIAETDPVDPSAAVDTRRLFTALTSHNGRRIRQNRSDQRSEEKPHRQDSVLFRTVAQLINRKSVVGLRPCSSDIREGSRPRDPLLSKPRTY